MQFMNLRSSSKNEEMTIFISSKQNTRNNRCQRSNENMKNLYVIRKRRQRDNGAIGLQLFIELKYYSHFVQPDQPIILQTLRIHFIWYVRLFFFSMPTFNHSSQIDFFSRVVTESNRWVTRSFNWYSECWLTGFAIKYSNFHVAYLSFVSLRIN